MKRNFWTIILVIGFVLSSAIQILILFAVYIKGGGTTGADPVTPILPFLMLALAATYVSIWQQFAVRKFLYVSALISGVFGSILPFWLEFSGSLVQYDRALLHESRLLDKEYLILPLSIFGFVQIGALSLGWYIGHRSNPADNTIKKDI
ncbi:MAG: hypothetical protein IPL32_09170 [Chloracidobacterium sp.]|nr:hypothetical protein [Chloracidobacterium sp.]